MRIKYLLLLPVFTGIFLFVIGMYYGLNPAPYIPQGFDTLHETDSLPKVIAHKGRLNANAIGNTLYDLEQILNSSVPALEIDVWLTQDGVPIVANQDDIDHNHAYSEIGNLLSLEKVFQLIKNEKIIFLTIKDRSIINHKLPKAINALIDQYNLHDTVVVESFNPFFLFNYRRIAPYKLIMYDFLSTASYNSISYKKSMPSTPWIINQKFFQEWVRWIIRPDILGPNANISLSELRTFKQLGYPIIIWTVDDPSQAKMYYKNNINGIQTNVPLDLLKLPLNALKIYDASRISKAVDVEIINITSKDNIIQALQKAKSEKRSVSAYGRRHSQGGQSFANGNLLLNMNNYNAIQLLDDHNTVRVESGATWKQIQKYLNPLGRALKIMQSDNIFSIGGSASVNVHGWQVSSGPMSTSVKQLKIILADGNEKICSKEQNSELFSAALGGYGLIGIISEIDLETVPNYNLNVKKFLLKPEDYAAKYQEVVTNNKCAELAYGRLNVSKNNLFSEALLTVFYRDENDTVSSLPIDHETLVAIKRQVFRASERSEIGKQIRWELEKKINTLSSQAHLSRNFAMSPDIQTLWPLHLKNIDILHEYFIPKHKFVQFINLLKSLVKKHDMNLLNVTIREILQDKISLLAYAKEDVFSFVLFFSQDATALGEDAMHAFTQELIAEVLKIGGSFYLPYRPHYTKEQLVTAYPNLSAFLELKHNVDPNKVFINNMYLNYLQSK